MFRAIELILQLCPDAKIASAVTDVWNVDREKRVIKLSTSQVNRLIGVEIAPKKVEGILNDLGFETDKIKNGFEVDIIIDKEEKDPFMIV